MPRSALKAGSTCPPLAVKTALTTELSIEGNASLKVFSACSLGLSGRGGFGGGFSIVEVGFGGEAAVDSMAPRVAPVARPLSSTTRARPVVNKSGESVGVAPVVGGVLQDY